MAASTNKTGANNRGGDWKLDSVVGQVKGFDPITHAELLTYSDILAWSGIIDFSQVSGPGVLNGSAHVNAQICNDASGGYTLVADGELRSTYAHYAYGTGFSLRSGSYLIICRVTASDNFGGRKSITTKGVKVSTP